MTLIPDPAVSGATAGDPGAGYEATLSPGLCVGDLGTCGSGRGRELVGPAARAQGQAQTPASTRQKLSSDGGLPQASETARCEGTRPIH